MMTDKQLDLVTALHERELARRRRTALGRILLWCELNWRGVLVCAAFLGTILAGNLLLGDLFIVSVAAVILLLAIVQALRERNRP